MVVVKKGSFHYSESDTARMHAILSFFFFKCKHMQSVKRVLNKSAYFVQSTALAEPPRGLVNVTVTILVALKLLWWWWG